MVLNPPGIFRCCNHDIILEMYRFIPKSRHGNFWGSPKTRRVRWQHLDDAAGCLPSASSPKSDLTIRRIAKLFALETEPTISYLLALMISLWPTGRVHKTCINHFYFPILHIFMSNFNNNALNNMLTTECSNIWLTTKDTMYT